MFFLMAMNMATDKFPSQGLAIRCFRRVTAAYSIFPSQGLAIRFYRMVTAPYSIWCLTFKLLEIFRSHYLNLE